MYAILWYAPLAIFALVKIQWQKYTLPIIFLGVNSGLVLLRVFFYQRFLVSIDLMLIVLAGISLTIIWELPKKIYKIGIIIFLLVFGWYSSSYILHKEPLLTNHEMDAIKQIKISGTARILTINPQYAPWLYGFTQQGIIAPGMFEHDLWNREKWDWFRIQATHSEQSVMLEEYQSAPLYIFVGEQDGYFQIKLEQNPKMQKINDYLWQVL